MKRVDVTGEVCPRPALIVRRELTGLSPDEELLVVGDYPPAERNLRRTCSKHGYDVTDVPDEASADAFALRIVPTAEAALGADEREAGEHADGDGVEQGREA
jgi:tRNA 2-thiouridine synthesizing protein A